MQLEYPVPIIASALADLFFPQRCVHCDNDYGEDGSGGLCTPCALQLKIYSAKVCGVCSHPGVADICRACRTAKPAFRRLHAVGWYEGVLGSMVKAAKFADDRLVMSRLQPLLLSKLEASSYDAIVPIPSDHDLNEDLTEALARRMNLPRIEPIFRLRGARRQVGLRRRERRLNAIRAFSRKPGPLPQAILLVDDISTTGASLDAAARLLHEGGALVVDAIVLAKAPRFSRPVERIRHPH